MYAIPSIGSRQVLVRNQRSLISRGSEIGRRYLRPEEIDPAIMGYVAAGIVEQVGAAVREVAVGQRVTVVAPHAEYVVGDLDSHDGICRALANALECTVVSPHYRLAPEHRFPAAVEDCVDAVHWMGTAGAAELGVDATRLAVGGDSAGGNLGAVVARHMAARGVRLSAQVLIYPACDTDTSISRGACG